VGTIGAGTFSPSGAFSLPRSYLYNFDIARYGDAISSAGPTWFIHAPLPDPTFAVIIADNDWFVWNSNGRTLDHILTDFYYEVPPSTVKHPLDYKLTYSLSPITHNPALVFEWFTGTPDFQSFLLPSQAFGYWLPRPLP
jgi:hypothetical protein